MWFWLAQHADRMGIQSTEKDIYAMSCREMLDLLPFSVVSTRRNDWTQPYRLLGWHMIFCSDEAAD